MEYLKVLLSQSYAHTIQVLCMKCGVAYSFKKDSVQKKNLKLELIKDENSKTCM